MAVKRLVRDPSCGGRQLGWGGGAVAQHGPARNFHACLCELSPSTASLGARVTPPPACPEEGSTQTWWDCSWGLHTDVIPLEARGTLRSP